MNNILNIYTVYNGCDSLKSDMTEFIGGLCPSMLAYSDTIDNADIVVFFCCSFTSERENNTTGIIKDLQNKGKRVIVSGCFLPRFKKQFEDVDFVHTKDLQNFFNSSFGIKEKPLSKKKICFDAHKTPIINIASGCVGHCAYCSIRQVRGKLISKPLNDILEKINQIEDCKRIKLVAQDVSAYGNDIGSSLPNLLRNIWDKHPKLKIELGNLNVYFLKHYSRSDLELFKYIEGNINLPVQSASNKLLKRMGRDYTIEDFYQLYEILSAEQCKISTDMIAGLPGEIEEDHKMSMDLMRDYYFNFAQIFMFDPRPNTRAATMVQVDTITKERRTIELITQFLSTFHTNNHCSYNKIKEIQFYNTNITI